MKQVLIGLAGYSGAGKTTAIDYFVSQGLGVNYYAGSILLEEIAKRGLEQTPDVERAVREEMRAVSGMAVFAQLALPRIREMCANGNVFLDAIYCPEEQKCYQDAFGDKLAVVAVSASVETRIARLACRADRPMPREKLEARDALERNFFKLDEVVANATIQINNDNTLQEFQRTLDELRGRLA